VVCSRHCIALHRGACRGGLQARQERRPGLQVPEVLIEASANIVVKAESVQVSTIRRPPAARGLPPFYRLRRRRFTGVPHYSSYVWRYGVQCRGVDGRPGESHFWLDVMACSVSVQERLRGWRCRGRSFGGRPRANSRVPLTGGRRAHSSWRGSVLSSCTPTTSEMALQCPEWRRGDGDGRTGLKVTEGTHPTSRHGLVRA
jgi:hypothetical protein